MRTIPVLVFIFCSLASSAQAQTNADFARDVLGGIDTVPTAASLDAKFEDPRSRLEGAAVDQSSTLYLRHRAITLLSLYPDARSRAFLEELLSDRDPQIRRMVVYTLGRTFGRQGGAELVSRIQRVIQEDEGVVAQWAVRSLRWIHHESAARLLRDLSVGSNAKLAKLAVRALKYRSVTSPVR